MKITKVGLIALLAISAVYAPVVRAQAPSDLAGFANLFVDVFESLAILLIGLAALLFLYGVAKFVMASVSGNEQGRSEGKHFMILGIVALFVMVSLYGIILVLTSTFGFGSTSSSILFPPA